MSVEVEKVVKEFVGDNKLFTSVDVANQVKSDGKWISNKAVSQELNYIFNSDEYPDYKITSIQVERAEDQVKVTALLYLPSSSLESEYTNIKAKPITPKDFDFDHEEIDLDDESEELDSKDEEDKMSDKDKDKDKDSKAKATFTKSKRNYRKFNFL